MPRYRIVPDRSQVWIEARSSVHPIHSRTDGLSGWVDVTMTAAGRVDLRSKLAAHVELPVDRLRSSNPLEERELRRRIDAKKFPTITGDATAIAEGGEGRYRVTGDVTFRGETRPHADELLIEVVEGGVLRLVGASTFDVREFGMDPPKILMLRVEPDVRVHIEVFAEPE